MVLRCLASGRNRANCPVPGARGAGRFATRQEIMMTTETNTAPALSESAAKLIKAKAGKRAAKANGKAKPKAKAKAKAKGKAKAAPAPRTESKQARFIAALRTAKGMSITEAAKEFDWQPHTVRGAVAGALKVKLKLKVTADQDEKRGTVYRIPK